MLLFVSIRIVCLIFILFLPHPFFFLVLFTADFIKVLKAQDGTINEFDGSLWGGMVEFVTVGRDKAITVTFRDGTEIQA